MINNTLFLDFYILCHFYNKKNLFINIKTKYFNFIIVVKQIIQMKKFYIVFIFITDSRKIDLKNISLNFKCNSNLILL